MSIYQWEFFNVRFNGAILHYTSETSAGVPHIVSSFGYPAIGYTSFTPGLHMSQTIAGSAAFAVGVPNTAAGLDGSGYHCGEITARTFQHTSFGINRVPQHTAPMNWGITCMQSAHQLYTGVECYSLQMDSIHFGNFFRLIKMTDGPSNSVGGSLTTTYELLATTPSNAWALGTEHVLKLFWLSDPYFLLGTWLVATVDGLPLFNIVHTGPTAIKSLTSGGQSFYVSGATNAGSVVWKTVSMKIYNVATVNGQSYPP